MKPFIIKEKGIRGYKAHPSGPVEFDLAVHEAVREAVGPDYVLMSDPVGEYTMGDAVRVGRQLERLGYKWFEEPFRDFELYKYQELCRTWTFRLRDGDDEGLSLGCCAGDRPAGRRYRPGGCELEGRRHRDAQDRPYGGGLRHAL